MKKKKERIDRPDCFAHKNQTKTACHCKAVKVKDCTDCPFYKTQAEYQEGLKRSFIRISGLKNGMELLDRYENMMRGEDIGE